MVSKIPEVWKDWDVQKHSDLTEQNLFHSIIEAPLGVPGVYKNLED